MKMPTSFKIMGQKITVVVDPACFTEKDGTYGYASYRTNQIQLRPSTETHPLNQEQLEQTFYHELIHFILYHAGAAHSGKCDYMHQDEGFVDLCGSLLHQAISTMEYGE
jgi:predicted SprT family Zn-dependent metalloprotease